MDRKVAKVKVSVDMLEDFLFRPKGAILKSRLTNPHIQMRAPIPIDYCGTFEFMISADNLQELEDGEEIPTVKLTFEKLTDEDPVLTSPPLYKCKACGQYLPSTSYPPPIAFVDHSSICLKCRDARASLCRQRDSVIKETDGR